MGEYRQAAVCRRGHVETEDITLHTVAERCTECGAKILTNCEACGGRIRGFYYVEGVIGFGSEYSPPDFCDLCGSPHSWASRQARIYQLENLLDEQDLEPAEALKIRDELEALRSMPEMDESEEGRRWEKIKKIAPGFVQAGGRIIETLVTAAIKAQLDL